MRRSHLTNADHHLANSCRGRSPEPYLIECGIMHCLLKVRRLSQTRVKKVEILKRESLRQFPFMFTFSRASVLHMRIWCSSRHATDWYKLSLVYLLIIGADLSTAIQYFCGHGVKPGFRPDGSATAQNWRLHLRKSERQSCVSRASITCLPVQR